jgi:CheY-like chemotaxis protein
MLKIKNSIINQISIITILTCNIYMLTINMVDHLNNFQINQFRLFALLASIFNFQTMIPIYTIIFIILATINNKQNLKQISLFNLIFLKYCMVNKSLLDLLHQQNIKYKNTIRSQKKYIECNFYTINNHLQLNNNTSIIDIVNSALAKQMNLYINNYKKTTNSLKELNPNKASQISSIFKKILRLNNNYINIFEKSHLENIEKNVDFQKILQDQINLYSNKKFNHKKIKFILNAAPIKVDINKQLINIVIKNLLDNAVKFSQKNSTIIITSDLQKNDLNNNNTQDMLHCEIKDEGVGINSTDYSNIFNPFFKKHNQAQFPGNGLGLTICKEIISLHQGEIWISNSLNKIGTVSNFTLPLKQKSNITTAMNKDSYNILVIDDEVSCHTSIELILKGSIFHTHHAINGEEGLDLLQKNSVNFDVILLDLMMPNITGLEVIKLMKANILLENIPIIVQSGTSDEALIQEVMQYKSIYFIRKPYSKNKLIFLLESIINQNKLHN